MTSIKWIGYITVAIVLIVLVVVFAATVTVIVSALGLLAFTVYVLASSIKKFCEERFPRFRGR